VVVGEAENLQKSLHGLWTKYDRRKAIPYIPFLQTGRATIYQYHKIPSYSDIFPHFYVPTYPFLLTYISIGLYHRCQRH
ncbi:hypothetical protein CHS0354_016710, partial [Potamilus streckersoni]